MLKKIIVAFCFVTIAMGLVACSAASGNSKMDSVVPSSLEKIPLTINSKVSIVSGDTLYNPKTLKEVEGLAEYIVKGRLLNDAKQKLYRNGSAPVIFGVTVSSFEISKVFKGDLKEGDKIPIAERYYTLEENGETTRYELDYAPSEPDKEYIFFLIKEKDKRNDFLYGFFTPSVKETGRYPVITPKDSDFSRVGLMSADELNLVKTEPDTYQEIYEQVIKKYMK